MRDGSECGWLLLIELVSGSKGSQSYYKQQRQQGMKFLTDFFQRAANQLPSVLRRLFSPTNSQTTDSTSRRSAEAKPRRIRKRKSFRSFMREEGEGSFSFSHLRRHRQMAMGRHSPQEGRSESAGSSLVLSEEMEHEGCTKQVNFESMQHEPDPEMLFMDVDGREISCIEGEKEEEPVMRSEESEQGRESDSDSEILRFVYGCPPQDSRQGRRLKTIIRKEWWREAIEKELRRRGKRQELSDEQVALQPTMFKKSKKGHQTAPVLQARRVSQKSCSQLIVATVIDLTPSCGFKIFHVPLSLVCSQ